MFSLFSEIFLEISTGTTAGRKRVIKTCIGELTVSKKQAKCCKSGTVFAGTLWGEPQGFALDGGA
jgi:hypothetical protein